MAKGRDRYGRFRGKGGIKPYKSNLSGLKGKQQGKKMSGRKKAILAVAATATVVGGAYAYNKRSQAVKPRTTKAPKAGKGLANGNPFGGTIARTKAQQPTRHNRNFTQTSTAFKGGGSTGTNQQKQQFQQAEQIVQGRRIARSSTMTRVLANQARRANDRI